MSRIRIPTSPEAKPHRAHVKGCNDETTQLSVVSKARISRSVSCRALRLVRTTPPQSLNALRPVRIARGQVLRYRAKEAKCEAGWRNKANSDTSSCYPSQTVLDLRSTRQTFCDCLAHTSHGPGHPGLSCCLSVVTVFSYNH